MEINNIQALNLMFRKINTNETLTLVEGKKDVLSLQSLGFKNIIPLNSKPLYKVVDELVKRNQTVAILTDLDPEGRKLYSTLQHQLKKQGIKIDNDLRNFLFKHTPVRHIEGLATYIKNQTLKQQVFKEDLLALQLSC